MEYKASLDSNALLTTIGTGVVLLLVAYTCIRLVLNVRNDGKSRFMGLLFLYGFILAIVIFMTGKTYLSMPSSYILASGQLVIHRPLSDIGVPFNDVERAWPVDSLENAAIKRVCGCNGFCGYLGKYADPKAGKMDVYATRRNNWIILITKSHGAIAISPDNMGLYNAILKKIGPK